MSNDFPDKQKGEHLEAQHVNAFNRVARDFRAMIPDRNTPAVPLRVMCITAVLTEAAEDEHDTEDQSSFSSSSSHSISDADSGSSFSSSSSSSSPSESTSSSSGGRGDRKVSQWYEALPMYWDHASSSWLLDLEDEPYDLDAGAFDGEFEVGDTCIAYWDTQRGMYVAQPVSPPASTSADDGDSENSDGTTSSSSCCCEELDCLKIAGYTDEITPAYYQFTPTTFRCYCDPASDAGALVKLYPTDDENIWESVPIQCKVGVDSAGDPVYGDAFWRLTIVPELGEYGCDETKLEFILDDEE